MVTLLDFWKEITFTIGLIGTFIAGRKSAKILEKKQQTDAIDTMQKTYDVFLKHYEKQYEKLSKRLDDLEHINFELTETAKSWESKFRELHKQHELLKKQFEAYKAKHN